MEDECFKYAPKGDFKIFPIDYSLEDLGEKWGADPRTIEKYLFKNDLLRKILLDLTPRGNIAPRGKIPLPVEAEPFLRAFFKLASSEYKSCFKKANLQTAPKNFCKKLCEELYETLCNSKNHDEIDKGAFCRHVLFHSDYFNAIVMQRQWSEQLQPRINLIRRLSREAPIEKQAAVLEGCLMAFDRICLSMLSDNFTDSELPHLSAPQPRSLLKELLLPRKNAFSTKKNIN